jgi:starvation-inducible outer membrane lipoprotein
MITTSTAMRHVLAVTVLALPLGLTACGSPPTRITKTTTTEQSTTSDPAVQSSTTTTTTRQTGP